MPTTSRSYILCSGLILLGCHGDEDAPRRDRTREEGAVRSDGATSADLKSEVLDKLRRCHQLSPGYVDNVFLNSFGGCENRCVLDADCKEITQGLCGGFEVSFGMGQRNELPPVWQCITACPDRAESKFACTDGVEVLESYVCDGENDCSGGEDEKDCTSFSCAGGQQVPMYRRCDDESDCADGSDEQGCATLCGG